jgi:ketosteroid isomerase-like protein
MEELRDLRTVLNRLAKRLEGDLRKLEAKVDKLIKLPDQMEIENLIKTMVWSMDLGDKDAWLKLWSDDIHYAVPQYDIDIRGKKALKEFGDTHIFNREKRSFSTLMNIMIDVTGDTATARDYYRHYGYPVNPETGEVSEEPSFSDGMHHYKLIKDEGVWKINSIEIYEHRRQEARR